MLIQNQHKVGRFLVNVKAGASILVREVMTKPLLTLFTAGASDEVAIIEIKNFVSYDDELVTWELMSPYEKFYVKSKGFNSGGAVTSPGTGTGGGNTAPAPSPHTYAYYEGLDPYMMLNPYDLDYVLRPDGKVSRVENGIPGWPWMVEHDHAAEPSVYGITNYFKGKPFLRFLPGQGLMSESVINLSSEGHTLYMCLAVNGAYSGWRGELWIHNDTRYGYWDKDNPKWSIYVAGNRHDTNVLIPLNQPLLIRHYSVFAPGGILSCEFYVNDVLVSNMNSQPSNAWRVSLGLGFATDGNDGNFDLAFLLGLRNDLRTHAKNQEIINYCNTTFLN